MTLGENDTNLIIYIIITLYSGTFLWKLKIIIKQINRNICVPHTVLSKTSVSSKATDYESCRLQLHI